jgi:hypothetical protein
VSDYQDPNVVQMKEQAGADSDLFIGSVHVAGFTGMRAAIVTRAVIDTRGGSWRNHIGSPNIE